MINNKKYDYRFRIKQKFLQFEKIFQHFFVTYLD